MSGEERSSPYKYILKKVSGKQGMRIKKNMQLHLYLVVTHMNGGVTTEYSMTT